MLTPTGNPKFDRAVASLESTRQAALAAAGSNQAQARIADIAFHTGIVTIAPTYGFTPLASQEALIELGVSPIPQAN